MAALPTGYQIAVAKFDNGLNFRIQFKDAQDAGHLSNDINHLSLAASTGLGGSHPPIDYISTLDDLINEIQHQHNGARAGVPKSVLILTNTRTDTRHHNKGQLDIATLNSLVQSITVVDVGGNNNVHLAAQYATDASHELSVPTYADLGALVPQLVSLLCA